MTAVSWRDVSSETTRREDGDQGEEDSNACIACGGAVLVHAFLTFAPCSGCGALNYRPPASSASMETRLAAWWRRREGERALRRTRG